MFLLQALHAKLHSNLRIRKQLEMVSFSAGLLGAAAFNDVQTVSTLYSAIDSTSMCRNILQQPACWVYTLLHIGVLIFKGWLVYFVLQEKVILNGVEGVGVYSFDCGEGF